MNTIQETEKQEKAITITNESIAALLSKLNPSMDLHHFQSMQFVMNEIKVCCFFPN
jgi:hypothetical protein